MGTSSINTADIPLLCLISRGYWIWVGWDTQKTPGCRLKAGREAPILMVRIDNTSK